MDIEQCLGEGESCRNQDDAPSYGETVCRCWRRVNNCDGDTNVDGNEDAYAAEIEAMCPPMGKQSAGDEDGFEYCVDDYKDLNIDEGRRNITR